MGIISCDSINQELINKFNTYAKFNKDKLDQDYTDFKYIDKYKVYYYNSNGEKYMCDIVGD